MEDLIDAGASIAHGPSADPLLKQFATDLAQLDPAFDTAKLLTTRLLRAVGFLYEHGWQPADVMHVVARGLPQRTARLGAAVVLHESVVHRAANRAPQEWLEQLAELGTPPDAGVPVCSGWFDQERIGAEDAWRDGLRLLSVLTQQYELQPMMPRPSEWGRAPRPRDAVRAAAVEPKTLARIRGLLAKAESTDFPDEAEALTAKAQDLMTRHAIDEAVLEAREGSGHTVLGRRVRIENPYAGAKVQLLDAVGKVNDAKVVWMEYVGMATVVGHPTDLDRVELLFTSLLVQATRALGETGRRGRRVVKSFRRAFYLSYATRIGERLAEVRAGARAEAATTYGSALVPVLAERAEAVEEAFEALFPNVRSQRASYVDREGWHAGRNAADRADLGHSRAVQGAHR